MKILHLFSNVKLTGPAEPSINLCASLKRAGLDVMFACCTSSKSSSRSVQQTAIERGLKPITHFRLNKHLSLKDNVHDLRRLPPFLKNSHIDIVHAHLDNDHLVGGRSSRKADDGILVIRSCYSGDGLKPTLRNEYSVSKLTDGIIVASESAREGVLKRYRFPEERLWVVPAAIDTERFSQSNISRNMRPQFGLGDDFVLGVVARIQPHRRFEIILEAMKKVLAKESAVKLLIVGRGSKMHRVAVEPVKRMHLEEHVKFAGFQNGQDYIDTLACFDAMIFLMPGTDGTCRAVREAMAMGKPVIAARRGMLPEIVDHAQNGIVIEDTPDTLAGAIRHLMRNRDIVSSMSLQAMKKARDKFRLNVQAEQVADIYAKIIELGRLRRSPGRPNS
jgi:glycosyltransferase involved in cell wall biosynthesis